MGGELQAVDVRGLMLTGAVERSELGRRRFQVTALCAFSPEASVGLVMFVQ
ncbi:Uncharacterized protein DAT39_020725 [Clarias magur]|uniref:Uncharacterized protein n=1 Tax=Clarias magur TaxID=1594786 RepID=A0A8J4TAH6_CLAMG|nr:Uncharacterized protein DAT39_020725 [Clarias magur]